MNTHKTQLYRIAAIGALTLILAVGAVFALPQGRAWAQSLLRFFAPGGDQIALPTPAPVNLVEVTPGASQPTLQPTIDAMARPEFFETCGDLRAPRCSLEQIRGMVTFPVKGITGLPQGMQFTGATGGPRGVTQIYLRSEPTSILILNQWPAGQSQQPVPVGDSAAIEAVQIGATRGEYVRGSYFSHGGDTTAIWDPNAELQSLRWEENGLSYSLTLTGAADFPALRLDRDGLVSLAAGLSEQAAAQPPAAPASTDLAAVEKTAGFALLSPAWLPEGYRFESAKYLPERGIVCLEYRHPADQPMGNSFNPPAPSLSIAESAATLPAPEDLVAAGLRPEQVILQKDPLRVGGAMEEQGLYLYGSLDAGQVCGDQSNQHQMLLLQHRGIYIAILANAPEGPLLGQRNWLTRQELVRVAESVTGVQTIAAGEPDPQALTSLEDVKRLAGFTLKLPARLPTGMNFLYGQVLWQGNVEDVILHYSDGNQVISVVQTRGNPDTLESISSRQPGVYQLATIHGQPALISQGYFANEGWKDLPDGGDGSASLIWFEQGIEYAINGFNAYPTRVWQEIAENLQ